jgi:UDP-2,3-diacylglucosamine pyrophosphatase LpxH
MLNRRNVQVCVISDVHLGMYGCCADQLLSYLRSIQPEVLILNGDIIDIWNFKKSYFPKSHIRVLCEILQMTESGTTTYYITGNHDEALRRYSGIRIGNLILEDKVLLNIAGKKTWIFHGDVFDSTTQGKARIIAKMGGVGYDLLIRLNFLINKTLEFFNMEKVSMSKKVKSSVKSAIKWISNFEDTAAILGMDQGFNTVICGHIHQPQMRTVRDGDRKILYLNSGDWVENCTALEYNDGEWTLYKHNDAEIKPVEEEKEKDDRFKIIQMNHEFEQVAELLAFVAKK